MTARLIAEPIATIPRPTILHEGEAHHGPPLHSSKMQGGWHSGADPMRGLQLLPAAADFRMTVTCQRSFDDRGEKHQGIGTAGNRAVFISMIHPVEHGGGEVAAGGGAVGKSDRGDGDTQECWDAHGRVWKVRDSSPATARPAPRRESCPRRVMPRARSFGQTWRLAWDPASLFGFCRSLPATHWSHRMRFFIAKLTPASLRIRTRNKQQLFTRRDEVSGVNGRMKMKSSLTSLRLPL